MLGIGVARGNFALGSLDVLRLQLERANARPRPALALRHVVDVLVHICGLMR